MADRGSKIAILFTRSLDLIKELIKEQIIAIFKYFIV